MCIDYRNRRIRFGADLKIGPGGQQIEGNLLRGALRAGFNHHHFDLIHVVRRGGAEFILTRDHSQLQSTVVGNKALLRAGKLYLGNRRLNLHHQMRHLPVGRSLGHVFTVVHFPRKTSRHKKGG
jgi:hypothetical protein